MARLLPSRSFPPQAQLFYAMYQALSSPDYPASVEGFSTDYFMGFSHALYMLGHLDDQDWEAACALVHSLQSRGL